VVCTRKYLFLFLVIYVHCSIDFWSVLGSVSKITVCIILFTLLFSELSLVALAIKLNHLQHIQNCLACAVVTAARSSNADEILRSLHWLKVQEHIEYKVISITYKLLQSSSPGYLRDLIIIQPPRSTRSSSSVTLLPPPVHSTLKITDRSFQYAVFLLLFVFLNPVVTLHSTPSARCGPGLVVHLSHDVFHSRLKTHLFSKYFPPRPFFSVELI